jgi:hypothetical protein
LRIWASECPSRARTDIAQPDLENWQPLWIAWTRSNTASKYSWNRGGISTTKSDSIVSVNSAVPTRTNHASHGLDNQRRIVACPKVRTALRHIYDEAILAVSDEPGLLAACQQALRFYQAMVRVAIAKPLTSLNQGPANKWLRPCKPRVQRPSAVSPATGAIRSKSVSAARH